MDPIAEQGGLPWSAARLLKLLLEPSENLGKRGTVVIWPDVVCHVEPPHKGRCQVLTAWETA